MKVITHLIVYLILAVSLTGCWICPEPLPPEIVIQYEYIFPELPKLTQRPEFLDYDMIMVEFEGKEYYVMEKVDGSIMSGNWEAYKNWSEANYDVLKSVKNGEVQAEEMSPSSIWYSPQDDK